MTLTTDVHKVVNFMLKCTNVLHRPNKCIDSNSVHVDLLVEVGYYIYIYIRSVFQPVVNVPLVVRVRIAGGIITFLKWLVII